jgi:hypothetical protein
MHSISRAGWASHGYFGFDAKTFGNPGGATSGDGYFVNGPHGGETATNWTPQVVPVATSTFGSNVAAGGGTAIIADGNGLIWYSHDGGAGWASSGHTIVTAAALQIAYAGGLFMALNGAGHAFTSPDGITWTTGGAIGFGEVGWLAGNGAGQWVVVSAGSLESSVSNDNGLTWTTSPLTGGTWSVALIWDGSQYVASGLQDGFSVIATAPDGVTWTFSVIEPESDSLGPTLVFQNGNYQLPAVNNINNNPVRNASTPAGIATAADVNTSLPGTEGLQCLLAGNGLYWGFDQSGNATGSQDGTTWSTSSLEFTGGDFPSTTFQAWDSVNHKFIVCGQSTTSLSTHTDANL